jgi:hypothetical protein
LMVDMLVCESKYVCSVTAAVEWQTKSIGLPHARS